MIDRMTKLRWRRRLRQSRRQVEDLGFQAEEQLERHFFRRLNRLGNVRRFIAAWLALMLILISGTVIQTRALSDQYQTLQPVAGGNFSEGVLGSFTDASPLYATGAVDSAVSHLLFAGLFKYNQKNQLVGDLAEGYTEDARGTTFTVKLKPNLSWHDGQRLTADDVVFTYQTIQNPDAKSPLFSSWQNIKVAKVDDSMVTFTLSNSLSSFPTSLTNGIVPLHVLGEVPVGELRTAKFNTVNPIGAGPFKWETIQVDGTTPETREVQIGLVPFEHYNGGEAKLQRFVVHSFNNQKQMVESFKKQEIAAMSGLDEMPADLTDDQSVQQHNVPLTSETMVFFKMTNDILKDAVVRQALTHAVNQAEILKSLDYPATLARSPLLPIHIGYDPKTLQLPYDVNRANALLDQAGWTQRKNGIRMKNNVPLSFKLVSQSSGEYAAVAQKLQSQWRQVGVDADVTLQEDADLQTTVSQHTYDALLYGISLGVDPDVFPFWHSSQADARLTTRLNFSEYKSTPADKALEAGRSRSDPTIRAIKYKPFLEAWRQDAPAVALYQPRYLYIVRGEIFNFDPATINTASDRYSNVQNWMIREAKVNISQ